MKGESYQDSPGYKSLVELLGSDHLAVMITNCLFRIAVRTPEQLAKTDAYDLVDARWIGPKSLERLMPVHRKLKETMK
jgi:DNA-directed RNA polymerase alpha subunit